MGAVRILVRRKTTEDGDANQQITGERGEEGSKSRGNVAKIDGARGGIEEFVAEQDAGKQDRRLLAEKSGKKAKDREKKQAKRRSGTPGTVIEEQGQEEKKGAQQLGESGDPGDRLGVHRVQGEDESRPKGEGGCVERGNQEIHERDNGGIEQGVDEMPGHGMGSEEMVFGDIAEDLQGTIVVAGGARIGVVLVGEGPNVCAKGLHQAFAFLDEGVAENLKPVIGDEAIAESGCIEKEG